MSETNGTAYADHGVEYVGFWVRFIAFLIDSISAMVLIAIVGVILFGGGPEITIENPGAMASRMSFETVVIAILFIAFWIYFASTPGKMIFDAYIVDARTHCRASKGQLLIRYLGYYVSMFFLMLGFFWIGFDERKQGWHDKMAGTVVIKGKPLDDDPDNA